MKFAYLVAQNMKMLDSGVVEADSMYDFFDNYIKEKGYYKNNVRNESNQEQYRSLAVLGDKPMSHDNTAGIVAFIVP